MLTKQEIAKIIKEAPLKHLFSDTEIEKIIEDLYSRYGNNLYNNPKSLNKNIYFNQQYEVSE